MPVQKTILVIDDEPDTLTYFTSLLEDNGYATVSAKNGEEALNCVKVAAPDLITLDITMPEMSGVKFYRTVREDVRWKHIPVVIITGVSENFKDFISSRRQVPPPDGFISKPIDREQFLELVAKLLYAAS
ncbi:MAG: response regulator [Calditrichaeota bacterium]|nr:response regulator [Calditrichota bacterium]